MHTHIGSLSTLLEYETARQRHNVPTALTIEGLYHLFSTSWTPAVLLRSIGFQITNALPNVKVGHIVDAFSLKLATKMAVFELCVVHSNTHECN